MMCFFFSPLAEPDPPASFVGGFGERTPPPSLFRDPFTTFLTLFADSALFSTAVVFLLLVRYGKRPVLPSGQRDPLLNWLCCSCSICRHLLLRLLSSSHRRSSLCLKVPNFFGSSSQSRSCYLFYMARFAPTMTTLAVLLFLRRPRLTSDRDSLLETERPFRSPSPLF